MPRDDSQPSRLLDTRPRLPRAFAEESAAVAERAHRDTARERELEAARAEGREHGREEARKELAVELEQARAALAEAVVTLSQAHDDVVRDCRHALVELALEAASCMLRSRVDDGDPVAVRALEQARAMLPRAPHLRVRVHSDDRDALAAALAADSANVELTVDDTVGRGGCVLETDHGIVDARVDTAVAELRQVATDGHSTP